MKRLIAGFAAFALAGAVAAPAWACSGEHGYKKTAQILEQSIVTAEKKAVLMQVITQNQADHDKYTAEGDYAKMYEAIQKLDDVKSQITK